jgi:orotate phosphoribosyltransferase
MAENVLDLLSASRANFLLESGHHGDLWQDLEALCYRPHCAQAIAADLAKAISEWRLMLFAHLSLRGIVRWAICRVGSER